MPLMQQETVNGEIALGIKAEELIFEGLTPYLILKWLREIVTINPSSLGNAEEAGLHSFRRGAATEAFMLGETEEKTRALGDWKSKQAADAYIPEHARKTREAALYIQGWEDSDEGV